MKTMQKLPQFWWYETTLANRHRTGSKLQAYRRARFFTVENQRTGTNPATFPLFVGPKGILP